ncbi:Uncharacterized protein Rs2_51258 [Raphanus sativus]|nr:Uncharacterized protein Rs2_51258 [Raphanus sativus]
MGLFGSTEQQISPTPETSASKQKRNIASCTPEQGSCLTSKKRRKNPPAVLKDITKISQIFVRDKGNMQSNTVDGTCEDHDSDDDDADIDNDIDFRGVLEEIDDSLEFDCSSQESSDTETEENHFADDVELETEYPQSSSPTETLIAKTSARATKRMKTKSSGNDYVSYITQFTQI